MEDDQPNYIFQSFPNSFKYLIDDARLMKSLASEAIRDGSFDRVKLCRTAILLFVLSLEGLANRLLDRFLSGNHRHFVMDREDRWSLLDKIEYIIISVGDGSIDKGAYPWAHLKELVKIRNELVHPKHDRVVFYTMHRQNQLDRLQSTELPDDLFYNTPDGKRKKAKPSDLIYSLTKISKDPYTLMPEDVESIEKVVFDVLDWLDKKLGCEIKKANWHVSDQMQLIYPPGKTLEDM